MFEPTSSNQESTFTHLTLLADMKMEYEQNDILNMILRETPHNPVCLELVCNPLYISFVCCHSLNGMFTIEDI